MNVWRAEIWAARSTTGVDGNLNLRRSSEPRSQQAAIVLRSSVDEADLPKSLRICIRE
jgi:hypothetical protein